MKPNRKNPILLAAIWFTLATPSAFAATLYWDVNGTSAGFSTVVGAWDTGAFWNTDSTGGSGGTVTATTTGGDDLIIGPATTNTGTITLTGTKILKSLTFDTTVGAVTLTGGTLSLAGGGITVASTAGNQIISSNLTINGNNIFNVGSGRTLTLNTGTFTRSAGATVNIQGAGTGSSTMTNLSANDATGIIGTWASSGTGTGTTYAKFSGTNLSGLAYTGGADGTSAAGAANITSTTGLVNYTTSSTSGAATGVGASINTLRYAGSGLTISSTNLLITKGIMNAGTGGLVFSNAVSSGASGTEMVVNAANNSVTFNGVLTGTITKTGSGTMILGGSVAHSLGGITINAGTLRFVNSAPLGTSTIGISISAGATLQSATTGTNPSTTIAAPITLVAGGDTNLVIGQGANGSTHTFNINGAIDGATTNLVFSTIASTFSSGTSVFVLGAAGTYTGNTTITTGASDNPVTVKAGTGIVNALPATTVLTMTGGAGTGSGRRLTYDLNGNNQTLAGLTHTATIPDDRNYTITSTNAATLTINNTDSYSFGGATKDSATGTNSGSITSAQITGAISLVKNGAGTFTLGGILTNGATAQGNSFTGSTKILGGILVLGQSTSIQNSAFDTDSILGDANNGLRSGVTTLTLGGLTGANDFSTRFTNAATGGPSGTTGRGGYDGLTALMLNPGTSITNTYSGDIGNGNGSMSLTKTGAGTQILSGPNTHTGSTTISGGTLSVATIGDGAVASGNLGSATNVAANLVFDGGTLKYTGASATSDRAFTINTGKTATIDTANGISFAGATGAATNGALTKLGAGTLTLTSPNTYTGATTISEGKLLMGDAASDTFASSGVTVASGATLGGSGTIAGTVGVTGILAPGITGVSGGIGTLATGETTWKGAATSGAATIWQFDLSANSNVSDTLAINGALKRDSTAGAVYEFNFMNSAPTTWGNVYTLLTWTTTTDFTSASQFTWSNLGGGYDLQPGTGFTLNGVGGNTGGSLTFTAVPEPTSAMAGLIITAGLLRRRRK